jgi:hypothetical protein
MLCPAELLCPEVTLLEEMQETYFFFVRMLHMLVDTTVSRNGLFFMLLRLNTGPQFMLGTGATT